MRARRGRHTRGDWNAICDVCGWKYKASDLRRRWDGLMVCKHDWEPDHPQRHVKAVPDKQSVPWVRTEPTDVYIDDSGGQCTAADKQSAADHGTAGCAIVGFDVDLAIEEPVPSGTFDNSL